MIKHFCNMCGKETDRNYITQPLKLRLEEYGVTIRPGVYHPQAGLRFGKRKEEFDICRTCLLQIVEDGVEIKEDSEPMEEEHV